MKIKRKSEPLDLQEGHDSKRHLSESSLLHGVAVAVPAQDTQWPAGSHDAHNAHSSSGGSGCSSGSSGGGSSSDSSSGGGSNNTNNCNVNNSGSSFASTHTPAYSSWPSLFPSSELTSWELSAGVSTQMLEDSAPRRAKALPKALYHSADEAFATPARSQPMVRRASYPAMDQHSLDLLSSVATSAEPAVTSVAALL